MTTGVVAGSERQRRGFRRIVELLIWLVILPTVVLLVLGILMMVFWQAQLNVLFGILVMTLVACLVTGTVLALVLLRREANVSRLQLDFVSKVSHELRTPLTSIRMFAEMLQQSGGRDPEETAVCLDVLHRETGRLAERIERLLDWGRMESGRRSYDLRPERVEDVVRAAIEAFAAATVGRDVGVSVELGDDLPEVLADRAALSDALLNLLSNAFKYTEASARIVVGANADPRSVRLWVRDNGVGIPRQEHRRIFEKFYRVDDRLARRSEGSGLGLAIVRHIALGHGGRVEVDSEPGRGSTFTLVLPRPKSAAAAPEVVREPAG